MQLVVNRNIHKSSDISRKAFLEKLSNVKAIRVNRDLWTINLYSALQTKAACPIKVLFQMIKKNDFTLYRGRSSKFIFGIRITKSLSEFINSTTYNSFLKQHIIWIATQVIDNPRLIDFILEDLGKPHARDVERIVDNYRSAFGNDIDDATYNNIFLQECGKLPYEFFQRSAWCNDSTKEKYNILESVNQFCFGIDEVYFTSIDWRDIVERGDDDPLIRSESDFEIWDEWKEFFSERNNVKIDELNREFDEDESGYVYIIHQKDSEHFKIGWSKTPNSTFQRVRHLQVGNPCTLYIYASFPASSEIIERKLQGLLDHKKVRGEWYKLSSDDLSRIIDPIWRCSNGIV